MSPSFSSAASDSYDYVQDTEPADPDEGDTWYSYAEDEVRVYDGATWQNQTVTDHGELKNVSAGDHFDAGEALAFGSGLLDLVYGNPLSVSGDTLGLDTVAPLTLSSGSLAVALADPLAVDGNDDLALTLANALEVDGDGNLGVVESDISHDNVADVASDDHHSRYSDDEARSAVDGSSVSVDHDNLTGVSAGDHFGAGDALAFNAGNLDLVYGDPLAVSGDTLGLDTVAPLTLSSGSLAVALGNALAVDGNDDLAVQESEISHDNLSGVSSSDHHSRYSDDEARSAVDGSNVSLNHDNLTGVSAGDHFGAGAALAFNGGDLDLVYGDPLAVSGDTLGLDTVAPLTLSSGSLAVALGNALAVDGNDNLAVQEGEISHDNIAGVSSSDHHTRYSDSEARDAVDGSSVSVDHDNLTGVSAGDHFGAGDALAFNAGNLDLVYGDPLAVSGDTLGLDTVAPLTLSSGSLAVALGNALAVDGNDNLAVQEGEISHDNIAGVSSSDHHSRYSDDEARSAVDGSNVSLDHGNLTGVGSSDHHSRYSDGEARSAVDGANVDIEGDADTVDGKDASELGGAGIVRHAKYGGGFDVSGEYEYYYSSVPSGSQLYVARLGCDAGGNVVYIKLREHYSDGSSKTLKSVDEDQSTKSFGPTDLSTKSETLRSGKSLDAIEVWFENPTSGTTKTVDSATAEILVFEA